MQINAANIHNAHEPGTAELIAATLAHLSSHFLTLDQLACAVGLTQDEVNALIDAKCMPPHSHEIRLSIEVNTTLWGSQRHQAANKFYSPSLVRWANHALELAPMPLSEIALVVRNRFLNDLRESLLKVPGAREANPDCFGQDGGLVEAAFATWGESHLSYLLDGTYCICLKEVSANNIVRKGTCMSILKRYLDDSSGTSVTDHEVEWALTEYDAVASLFLPAERAGSSRTRLFEAARKKFCCA
ncbi:MAG: hypothetical protein JNM76_10575 [Betaproteobacteria bacterium]|nr:hypothetical protein [Betaproteobacteria bacterium]